MGIGTGTGVFSGKRASFALLWITVTVSIAPKMRFTRVVNRVGASNAHFQGKLAPFALFRCNRSSF